MSAVNANAPFSILHGTSRRRRPSSASSQDPFRPTTLPTLQPDRRKSPPGRPPRIHRHARQTLRRSTGSRLSGSHARDQSPPLRLLPPAFAQATSIPGRSGREGSPTNLQRPVRSRRANAHRSARSRRRAFPCGNTTRASPKATSCRRRTAEAPETPRLSLSRRIPPAA